MAGEVGIAACSGHTFVPGERRLRCLVTMRAAALRHALRPRVLPHLEPQEWSLLRPEATALSGPLLLGSFLWGLQSQQRES